ncbi:MAG: peptidoglycan-binding domain-containing protein, partial [Thermaerobacter sp.]|nr:peptidoglycan-binding domain-containing protein [Thermaerobacter sp.]
MALFDDTFTPYHPFGSRNLSSGATGTDVAVLRAVYDLMLEVMNPPKGPMGSPIPITKVYDAAAVQAVKNIQSYFGLSVDGIAGPNTYFVFGQGVGSRTTFGGPVYGSRQLSEGDTGGDVTILQNRLN